MKKAFTLAEVLITLGIIGVVAALTAPALVKNAGTAKIGPSLAKFVNTFETASETLLHDQSVDKISSIASNATDFADQLSHYMIMTPATNRHNFTIFPMKDTSKAHGYNTGAAAYVLKDGSVAIFADESGAVLNLSGGPYKGIRYSVLYDINGANGNNAVGKEVFGFFVDDSGILVPYGSTAAHSYTRNEDAGIVSGAFNRSTSICEPNSSAANTEIARTLGCAGRISDNGWKVPY